MIFHAVKGNQREIFQNVGAPYGERFLNCYKRNKILWINEKKEGSNPKFKRVKFAWGT